MTFDDLMHRSRQWDRDHAKLMQDHAEYRERLDAAARANCSDEQPPLSPSRAEPTSCLGASRFNQLSQGEK